MAPTFLLRQKITGHFSKLRRLVFTIVTIITHALMLGHLLQDLGLTTLEHCLEFLARINSIGNGRAWSVCSYNNLIKLVFPSSRYCVSVKLPTHQTILDLSKSVTVEVFGFLLNKLWKLFFQIYNCVTK